MPEPRGVAVVTGASRGIGRAVARALPHHVVGAARSEPDDDAPAHVTMVKADVRDPGDVARVFEVAHELHGPVNTLVTCAGVAHTGAVTDLDLEALREQVDTNLIGTILCVRAFVAQAPRRSVAVLVSSTSGLRPSPGWAVYGSTKAAVANLAASLDEEMRDRGIRVFCVAPGRCATALRAELAPDEDPATIMQPREVAGIVYRLVTDAQFPVGQVHTELLAGQTLRVAR
jgi:3-oxoacyl-[acyl-carrier protein] reductase